MQKEVAAAVADLHHLAPLPDLHPQGLAPADQEVQAVGHQVDQDHHRQAVECSEDPTTATILVSSLSLMDAAAT